MSNGKKQTRQKMFNFFGQNEILNRVYSEM